MECLASIGFPSYCSHNSFDIAVEAAKGRPTKTYLYFLEPSNTTFLIILIFVGYEIYSKSLISLLFIIFICIFSDTGGYLVGNLIGGRKLTKISPKKTISGSIGSFIFSLIPILIFWIYFQSMF